MGWLFAVLYALFSDMVHSGSLHMQHLIPRWQDADKHRRLKIIMSDRPDLINSEMGGVAFNSVDQCFKQALLKQMFSDAIPVRIEFNTRFFVTIDPAAGGEHSDFAMVSFTCSHGIYKVYRAFIRIVGGVVSREHHESLDFVKDFSDAGYVLSDCNLLEEIFLRNRTQDGDGNMGVKRGKHYALSQERVLDVFGETRGAAGHEIDFFLNILVLEQLVLVCLLCVEDPVSHFVVDGQEKEKEHDNVRVAYRVAVEFLNQLVEAKHGSFEATVILPGVGYHVSHQHAHEARVLRKDNIEQHIVHL